MRRLAALFALIAAVPEARAGRAEGDQLTTQIQGAGLGAAIGGGICALIGYGAGGKDKEEAVLGGAAFGIVIGLPIGLQMYADDRGGTGRGYGTLLGTALGLGAAVALVYGERKSDDSAERIVSVLAMMLMAVSVGPIAGYRITADEHGGVPMPIMIRF
jgi:hypothetical protein